MIVDPLRAWVAWITRPKFLENFEIFAWVFIILEPFQKIFSIQRHRHSRWHLFRLKIVEDFEFRILSNCLSYFVLKMNRPEGTLFWGHRAVPRTWRKMIFVGDTSPDGCIRSCWGVFSSKSSPIDASECAVEYVLFCFGNFPFSVSGSFSISVITDMLTCGSCADFGRNTADDIVLWLVAPVSVIEAFDWLRCNDSWFSVWSVLGPWRELTDWRTFVFCLVRFIFASLNSRTRDPWNGQKSSHSILNLFLLSEFSTWEFVVADFVWRGKTRVGFPLGPAVPDATGPEVFKSRPEELLLGPSPRLFGRIIPSSASSCSVWFRLTCDWSIRDWLITEPRTGAPSSVWSRSSGAVWLVR